MAELHLWTNDTDIYVAESAEHAAELWKETTGDEYEGDGFRQVPDEEPFGIIQNEASDEDLIAEGYDLSKLEKDEYYGFYIVTKPAREWATALGPLCSTEW